MGLPFLWGRKGKITKICLIIHEYLGILYTNTAELEEV